MLSILVPEVLLAMEMRVTLDWNARDHWVHSVLPNLLYDRSKGALDLVLVVKSTFHLYNSLARRFSQLLAPRFRHNLTGQDLQGSNLLNLPPA